jgi:hypothetical protein
MTTEESKTLSLDEKRQRYLALMHAVQSGVAYTMERDRGETEPKHLRVGINAAMCDHGALVGLLVAKDVITDDEYLDALIAKLEEEVASYERRLSEAYGAKIRLG